MNRKHNPAANGVPHKVRAAPAQPPGTLSVGQIVNGTFRVARKLGKGTFGVVYLGNHVVTGQVVAIKSESRDKRYMLTHECEIYRDLLQAPCPPLVPNIYWYGYVGDVRVMVMQNLGNTLDYLLQHKCGGRFSLKTTLMLGLQMLDSIRNLHSAYYIHRDLKPENFLMGTISGGTNTRGHVYLIDFGLAKRYKSPDHIHIKERNDKKLVGTARYASANSHNGLELSRRDDLESLAYILIYFLKGTLPWQGLPVASREAKYKAIGDCKSQITPEALTEGLPIQFGQFLRCIRALGFKEKPPYDYLRGLLSNLFRDLRYQYDYQFDWTDAITETSVGAPLDQAHQLRVSGKTALAGPAA